VCRCGFESGSGIKSGPKWPGSGSGVRIQPIIAWIWTPFFFIFDFSLRFDAFDHSEKGVKAKAKAKAMARQPKWK
jgi:hypothetical protein